MIPKDIIAGIKRGYIVSLQMAAMGQKTNSKASIVSGGYSKPQK
jgi:hypothetical protein